MLIDRNHPPVTTHHVRTTYHHVTCFSFGHRVLKAVLHQMCDALAVATHPIKGSRSISYSARPSRGACSEASLYFAGVFCPIPTDRTVIYRCFTVSLWEFAMLLRSIWAILSPNVAWTMLHACVSKEPVLYPSCFMVFEGHGQKVLTIFEDLQVWT